MRCKLERGIDFGFLLSGNQYPVVTCSRFAGSRCAASFLYVFGCRNDVLKIIKKKINFPALPGNKESC